MFQIQDMIPMIMNHLPGPHQKITTLLEELNDFVAERVKLNQETLDQQNPRDYIDCFLNKMQEVPTSLMWSKVYGQLTPNVRDWLERLYLSCLLMCVAYLR